VSEMNAFELSDATARNSSNGTNVVLVVNFDESNLTRYCIDRYEDFSLLFLPCTPAPVNQLWVRLPSEEICVPGSPHRCLHYDSTISNRALIVKMHADTPPQQWRTVGSGQLQLLGADVCVGFVRPPSSYQIAAGVSCSSSPFVTIAFGHASGAKLFRPLGFQRLRAITSHHRGVARAGASGNKYEQNDQFSRLNTQGARVIVRIDSESEDTRRCLDRVSAYALMICTICCVVSLIDVHDDVTFVF
jgi:hypothetical protein